jgi:hypothetical protein
MARICNWQRTNTPESLSRFSKSLGDTSGGKIETLRRGRSLLFVGITSDTCMRQPAGGDL